MYRIPPNVFSCSNVYKCMYVWVYKDGNIVVVYTNGTNKYDMNYMNILNFVDLGSI